MGLNITAANRVVIFDPNWNPALDLQAGEGGGSLKTSTPPTLNLNLLLLIRASISAFTVNHMHSTDVESKNRLHASV